MTKYEEKRLKREQELAKIREEIRQKEIAWEKAMHEDIDKEACIDPHFKPLDWSNNGFIPDANHWTNIKIKGR